MRIPSAVSSPSATEQTASKAVTSAGSFQAILTHASTEVGGEARPTGTITKAPQEKAEDSAKDESMPTVSVASEGGSADATEDVVGERLAMGPDTAAAIESSAAVTGTAGTATDISTGVASSSDGYLRQAIADVVAGAGSSDRSMGVGTNVGTTGGTAVRSPGKQDRSKTTSDVKDASTPAAADVAVVDQSRIPMVTMASWQVGAHSQLAAASGNTAKNAVTGSSSRTKEKPVESVGGTADTAADAANVSSGASGLEQVVLAQPPAGMFEGGLDLSTLAGLTGTSEIASAADSGVATGKPVKDPAAADDWGSLKAPDGVSYTKSPATGTVDTSSHAVANGTQIPPGAQVDLSKSGAGLATSKVAENVTASIPVPAVAHQGATLQRESSAATDTAHAAKAEDLPAATHLAGGDSVAASGINSAKLIQTMGETEMHVGMHSAEFGDISIRTSLSQQQMVTQISLDHNDLSQAISTHLSTMQAKLGEEYGLHASIEINNQGAQLSSGQGDSSQRDQQPSARSSAGTMVDSAELSESSPSLVALTSAGSGHGLDIRV